MRAYTYAVYVHTHTPYACIHVRRVRAYTLLHARIARIINGTMIIIGTCVHTHYCTHVLHVYGVCVCKWCECTSIDVYGVCVCTWCECTSIDVYGVCVCTWCECTNVRL
jgi:hypothetical protein